jgi:endoglucanase
VPPALSHALPRLAVAGNRIIRQDIGAPVLLRGLNRSGLEYSRPEWEARRPLAQASNTEQLSGAEPQVDNFFAAAAFTDAEFDVLIKEWGANILRIPFNQEWALRGCPTGSATDYLSSLDRVIESAARRGAYTLLDLHWLDADRPFGHLQDGQPSFVPPLPNPETPALWRLLAERYRHEPAVLFDLFNEPHTCLPGDLRPLHLIAKNGALYLDNRRRVSARDWRRWALHLTDIIRQVHPQSLIFVSGVDWSYDLRGIKLNRANIIYSAHVYADHSPKRWQSRFGHVAADRPLFIGEWGGSAGDLEWGRLLETFLNTHACGWTAWSWTDHPALVENGRGADYRPTPFGTLVKRALALAIPPQSSGG